MGLAGGKVLGTEVGRGRRAPPTQAERGSPEGTTRRGQILSGAFAELQNCAPGREKWGVPGRLGRCEWGSCVQTGRAGSACVWSDLKAAWVATLYISTILLVAPRGGPGGESLEGWLPECVEPPARGCGGAWSGPCGHLHVRASAGTPPDPGLDGQENCAAAS